jgi:hypothetical protein
VRENAQSRKYQLCGFLPILYKSVLPPKLDKEQTCNLELFNDQQPFHQLILAHGCQSVVSFIVLHKRVQITLFSNGQLFTVGIGSDSIRSVAPRAELISYQ